ncbi:hypothetical protein HD554DRAFT_2035566 [Boletus coccyginus]|nr:hypothetical protein HD554DRAFT_2035566 [Boletus coccyginus]
MPGCRKQLRTLSIEVRVAAARHWISDLASNVEEQEGWILCDFKFSKNKLDIGAREIFINLSLILAGVRDGGVEETAPVTRNRGIAGRAHGACEQARRNVNLKAHASVVPMCNTTSWDYLVTTNRSIRRRSPPARKKSSTRFDKVDDNPNPSGESHPAATRAKRRARHLDKIVQELRDKLARIPTRANQEKDYLDDIINSFHADFHTRNEFSSTPLYPQSRIQGAADCLLEFANTVNDEFIHRSITALEGAGDEASNIGERDEAVAAYFTALSLGPTVPEAVLMKMQKLEQLGDIVRESKKHAKVIRFYSNALSLNPTNNDILERSKGVWSVFHVTLNGSLLIHTIWPSSLTHHLIRSEQSLDPHIHGRLYDKTQQVAAFPELLIYNGLRSPNSCMVLWQE